MDWTKGYSAHWRVYLVDVDTWADGPIVEGVSEVEVDRTGKGDAPLLESGKITIDGGTTAEGYLRVVMDAEQAGARERVDVATLLCSSVSGTADRGAELVEYTGRSVLYPASVRLLTAGTYAPAGADGVQWCASMLRDAIQAPVETEGGFTLDSNVVFGIGTSYLECVWQVLDAGGYCVKINGRGVVRICPLPSEPSLTLDSAGASLLQPEIRYELDWSEVPNRYTAVDGAEVATVENDDPSSPVSTAARGYVHDVVDKSPTRVNGETLTAYAARKLEESSVVPDTRTYNREFWPEVGPYDVVRGTLQSVELDGVLRVEEQTLKCGLGIVITEKAKREVALWQR